MWANFFTNFRFFHFPNFYFTHNLLYQINQCPCHNLKWPKGLIDTFSVYTLSLSQFRKRFYTFFHSPKFSTQKKIFYHTLNFSQKDSICQVTEFFHINLQCSGFILLRPTKERFVLTICWSSLFYFAIFYLPQFQQFTQFFNQSSLLFFSYSHFSVASTGPQSPTFPPSFG